MYTIDVGRLSVADLTCSTVGMLGNEAEANKSNTPIQIKRRPLAPQAPQAAAISWKDIKHQHQNSHSATLADARVCGAGAVELCMCRCLGIGVYVYVCMFVYLGRCLRIEILEEERRLAVDGKAELLPTSNGSAAAANQRVS